MFGGLSCKRPFSSNPFRFSLTRFLYSSCLLFLFACDNNASSGNPSNRLPSYKGTDVLGKEVDFGKFRSTYVYLHFLRTLSPNDEIDIEKICKDLSGYRSARLLFILSPNSRPVSLALGPNISFVYDKDGQINRLFNAPGCCDSYQLYNPKGELIYRGLIKGNSPDEINSFLIDVITGNVQYLDKDFKQHKINDSGLLADLVLYKGLEVYSNAFFVIGFISEGCVNCRIAGIISRVNRVFERCQNHGRFIVELPSDYSDTDLINFVKAFQISVTVARPPQGISLIWDQLRNRYAGLFDNFFVIVNTKGEILNYLDDGGSEDLFFDYLDSLVR